MAACWIAFSRELKESLLILIFYKKSEKSKFKDKYLISKYKTIFLNQVLKETIVEMLNILKNFFKTLYFLILDVLKINLKSQICLLKLSLFYFFV